MFFGISYLNFKLNKMKTYKIAWRNLWRNRKRTAITSASILFAVFFAVTMRSFQLGFYDHMIKNAIESFSGFLQVQNADYQHDPSLENSIVLDGDIVKRLEQNPRIKTVVPHLETFALASTGNQTKGALVVGIDPEKEKGLSDPENRLVKYKFTPEIVEELSKKEMPDYIKENLKMIQHNSYSSEGIISVDMNFQKGDEEKYLPVIKEAGKYYGESLNETDEGVLVSDKLARYLKVKPGDTIVLMGMGYHGATAAGLYPVRGLVKIPSPELDNKLIYMTLQQTQLFCNLDNRVTSISINLKRNTEKEMIAMQDELNRELTPEGLVVRTWKEFNKVLKQQIEGDNQSGKVMLGLLYFIIFFGIFGTVLMMIHERYREFGVLVAIGMQKIKLVYTMIIEMVFMGLLGVFSGTLLSLPLLYIGHNFPYRLKGDMAKMMEDYGFEAIMPLAWIDKYVLWQALIVALMVVLACMYPLRKVYKIKAVNALRA